MLRKTSKKNRMLSDKIAKLILHPDNDERSEESDEETAPRIEYEFDEYNNLPDARSTEIRKRNIKLLSEQSARYKGKLTSRKDFEEEDTRSLEAEEFDSCEADVPNQLVEGSNSNRYADHEISSEIDDDKSSYEDESNDSHSENERTNVVTETNHRAEMQKGTCVQNQLRIWEKLLELRIHSQKVLNKANQLPTQLKSPCKENQELQRASQNCAVKTGALLNSLLELQNTLANQFSEIRKSLKNSLKRPLPSPASDEVIPSKRFADHLGSCFSEMRSYRNAVLLKWDDRTKLLVPGAGTKRKSLNQEFDIILKIETALMSRDALIKKSQFLKSGIGASNLALKGSDSETVQTSEAISPKESPLQSNANIYDDSDFYHQQLRELIEHKANTTSNMTEVTKQYVELQKLRQKMKKKVDTRASKGRKLRYVVHNKLINFMAPEDSSTWTEESKSELCKSLFASE